VKVEITGTFVLAKSLNSART